MAAAIDPFYQHFQFRTFYLGEISTLGIATFPAPVPAYYPETAFVKILANGNSGSVKEVQLTRTVQGLDSGLVKMYCYYQTPTGYVMFLEHCEGGSVHSRLEKERWTMDQLLTWFRQLSHAVASMHSIKIAHRDIKPLNIFFTKNNEVRLGDFGEASFVANDRDTYVRGTIVYMPGPLRRMIGTTVRKSLGFLHDIFSLGKTFYEMCIQGYDQNFDSQTNDMPHLLSRVEYTLKIRGYPPGLYRLIQNMLSIEIKEMTIGQVVNEIELLANPPPEPPPVEFPGFGSLPNEFLSIKAPIERCQYDSSHSGTLISIRKCSHMYCRKCLEEKVPQARGRTDLTGCPCPICDHSRAARPS